MTAQEKEAEAREKAEEMKTFIKEKMDKAMSGLKDGMKTFQEQSSIVHRHFLEAQKELLQHRMTLIDSELKKLDEIDEEVSAKTARKPKTAGK